MSRRRCQQLLSGGAWHLQEAKPWERPGWEGEKEIGLVHSIICARIEHSSRLPADVRVTKPSAVLCLVAVVKALQHMISCQHRANVCLLTLCAWR